MVTIERIGKDKCQLNGKEADGVYCTFANGSFKGFLSWQSLKQLCKLQAAQQPSGQSSKSTS